MGLYENWMKNAFSQEGTSVDEIWESYLPKEQKIYEYMIGQKVDTLEGTIQELATKFNMTTEEFAGFVDGINESLVESFDMESLEETTQITLKVSFEQLYKKMIEYKAEHLYTLPQWAKMFDEETLRRFTVEQKRSRTIIKSTKISRNDPCPCGSGKKYKKCCGVNV